MRMILAAAVIAAFCGGVPALAQSNAKSPGPPDFKPSPGGVLEVVDGDTVWIDAVEVRLRGIDAPEIGQDCWDSANKKIDCFSRSKSELQKWVSMPGFHCVGMLDSKGKPQRNHNRYVATCMVGTIDVNRAMVESGWAFGAYHAGDRAKKLKACGSKQQDIYSDVETAARAAKRGLYLLKVYLDRPCQYRRAKNSSSCSDDDI